MIVIPMAGLSSRFTKAGYELPKYMLELNGLTLFEHAILSFEKYFATEEFLFIALDNEFGVKDFILNKVRELKIANCRTVIFPEPTRGQAETVYLGLLQVGYDDVPMTIFNIDTFRPGFIFPEQFDLFAIDGYLETFIGSGANWSNIMPVDSTDRVSLTAEKQEISKYCCTGLYYWKSSRLFCDLVQENMQIPVTEFQGNEYYIAPMYNDLIAEGKDIRFNVIDRSAVVFCGTPEEYQGLLSL